MTPYIAACQINGHMAAVMSAATNLRWLRSTHREQDLLVRVCCIDLLLQLLNHLIELGNGSISLQHETSQVLVLMLKPGVLGQSICCLQLLHVLLQAGRVQ